MFVNRVIYILVLKHKNNPLTVDYTLRPNLWVTSKCRIYHVWFSSLLSLDYCSFFAFLQRFSPLGKGLYFSFWMSLFLEDWRETWTMMTCFSYLTLWRSKLKFCGKMEQLSDFTQPNWKVRDVSQPRTPLFRHLGGRRELLVSACLRESPTVGLSGNAVSPLKYLW